MEEIYKVKTIVTDSPFYENGKIIHEEFAVYDEEVKKITDISDVFVPNTNYEFNFNGYSDEALFCIEWFARALGYTEDVWKNVENTDNDFTIDYPETDRSLEFEDGENSYLICSNALTKKIQVICKSEKLKENHEYFDEVIINAYAQYLNFKENRLFLR